MVTYIFYCIIIVCILCSLIYKKTKKFYRKEKKDIGERVHETVMTVKITTLRTLYVHVVSNEVMIPQILYDIVLLARHFLLVKFFPEYYSFILYFELPQNVTWTDE